MERDGATEANERTQRAWNANAAFWDERMGEGNDFVNVLIWPATLRLLEPQPGQRILDIACGNGLHASTPGRIGRAGGGGRLLGGADRAGAAPNRICRCHYAMR